MAMQLDRVDQAWTHGFDQVIDVRSPGEFAVDHIPGSINLPVLDDDERARVGTMYTQVSRFEARKLGASLVLRNVGHHLATTLADRPAGWRPLVYCWRGGQRSGTFAWLMREVGWRAETIDGGYRSYRRLVARLLHEDPLPWRFVLLQGMTCTGKTDLLAALDRIGVQVVDLEGLAHHRGSVFGGYAEAQPSQKAFETALARALHRCDPARPVVVEAESSKIGDLLIPPQVWRAMCDARRVAVTASLPARAAYFETAYADLVADPDRFAAHLDQLVPLQGYARVEQWKTDLRAGDIRGLAAGLMRDHYDPRYARSNRAPHGRVTLDVLTPEGFHAIAPRLAQLIDDTDAPRVRELAKRSLSWPWNAPE